MGVSKNKGTPKWMVKIVENPIKIRMIWGEAPLFLETSTSKSLSFFANSTGSPEKNPKYRQSHLSPTKGGLSLAGEWTKSSIKATNSDQTLQMIRHLNTCGWESWEWPRIKLFEE